MARPRLTDAVLRGIISACARADTDLDALAADAPEYRREARDVARAWRWASAMLQRRAEEKGVTYAELVTHPAERSENDG